MRIGTIGAGEVALAVAREALARGHEIVLSSRSGPGALAGKVAELGKGASAATVADAASLDYVLLAVTPPTRSPRPVPSSSLPTSAVSAPARLWLVSRQGRASLRHSIPFAWPTSMKGRARTRAHA